MATEAGRNSIGVRVRPNANNFINDLRTDLASKKYTFYVDIKAKTQGATRDVKNWAATDLKNVKANVYVGANMSRATSDVARWRERQAQIKTQVFVTANTFEAQRDITAWRAMAGRDLEIKVKANVSGRLTEIERLRKSAEKEAKLTVRGDTSNVKRDIKQGLDDAQLSMFTVGVDADTKKAEIKVNDFILQGEQLGLDLNLDLDTKPAEVQAKAFKQKVEKENPRAKVLLETSEARRDLAKLRLEAARKKLAVEVEVKANKANSLSKQIEKWEKGFGGGSVIRSLDFGPINLGKPTGFLGTITQITAFAGLVPGLVTGVAALSDAFVRLSGAVAMLPGTLASLGASFGTFQVGAFGFADALDAMFKVWTEPTDRIERTQRNTIKWTNDLSKALTNEKQAQKAVGDARRDATNELRNLNNELRGSVLNEAQAILDLQRAKDRLAQGDFENNTERTQAILDVAKAEEALFNVREGNTQLNQKAAQKQQQGIEQSDQVTAALEQQARATEAVALAMQSLSMANPMGAQSNFQDAMNRLSPNAREAVEAIGGLRSEITEFQRGLQDIMFLNVGDKIRETFANLAPTVMPGMNAIAEGLNQNILQIFDTLQSPDGQSIIERILGGTAEAQRMFSGLIDPLIRGFGTLMAAGAEHLPQLVQLFTTLAERFALFIETADKDGSLDKFLSDGIDALGNMAELGINLVKVINDFSNAFRGAFGTDLLTKMVQMTDQWHKFLSSEEGQKRLNGYLEDAKNLWNDWKPILQKLPEIFDKVQSVALRFLDVFLPVLDKVVGVLEKTPGLVEAFAGAWIGAKMLGAGKGIFEFGKTIWGIGGAIGNMAKWVGGLGQTIGGFLTKMLPYIPVLKDFGKGANPFNQPFLPDVPDTKPGAPGVVASGAAALATVAAPTLGAGWLSNAMTSRDLPILQQIALGFKQPVRWYNDLFNGGSDTTRIDRANEKLKGVKIDGQEVPSFDPEGHDAAQAVIGKMVQASSKAGEWVAKADSNVEQSRRYTWLFTQPNAQEIINDPNFVPPENYPSYKAGGFTDWPRGMGKNAMLHGQEFVLPAESVDFYGKDFMEGLRQRKLNFEDGGGLVLDPLSGRYISPGEQPHGMQAHGQGPGILGAIAGGVAGIAQNAITQATGAASAAGGITPGVGTGPLPGPAAPGMGTGPLPGPAPATPIAPGGFPGVEPKPLSMNIGGLDVPLGAGIPTGWPTPDGLPPVGLGRDGFDIRRFGIGPGPAGSTPGDWLKWTTGFIGSTVTNFGSAILGGVLDIFGLGGMMSNPYVSSALGLGAHFFESAGRDQNIQAAGADQANANALGLIDVRNNMLQNPTYPGIPGALPPEMQQYFPGYGTQFMPGSPMAPSGVTSLGGMIAPGAELGPGNIAGGEAGLQRDAIATRRIISAAFPFLQTIGGYRQDALKWHPSGRALDVMIPNSDTPQGKAIGDAVTSYVLQNAQEMNLDHVIWRGMLYPADGSAPQPMNKTGNWTQDHMDHPHIAFKGAGYPDANTKYYAPSQGIVPFGLDQNGYPVPFGGGSAGMLPGSGGLFTPGGSSSGPGNSPTSKSSRPTPRMKDGSIGRVQVGGGTKDGNMEIIRPDSLGSLLGAGESSGSSGSSSSSASNVEDKILKEVALRFGIPESEMSAFLELVKNKNAVEVLRSKYGLKDGGRLAGKAKVLAQVIASAYDNSPVKALNTYRAKNTFNSGGAVFGAGSATSDSIPALLSNGEHVLTAKEVEMMGGQDGVYAFRSALQNNKFAFGGAVTAYVPPPKPIVPPPAPTAAPTTPTPSAGPMSPPAQVAQPTMEPKPSPIEQSPQPEPLPGVEPQPTAPPIGQLPGQAPTPEPPQDPNLQQGPQGGEVTDIASQWLQGGVGTAQLDRNHPALSAGIMSGAAALGNVITTAVQAAATAGAAGGTMGAGAPAGAAAGALASSLISGAFQQGGKIVEGAANVASNFLVGNLTGGTTENSYGVTQVANQPRGGTKIYDASTSIGSIQTADLEGYYRMENRRQAQRAQSGLGHWGNR